LALAVQAPAGEELRLPRIFSDNMVLQRELPIPVWGWAKPGSVVSVTLGETSAEATAAADGRWRVTLPARPLSRDPTPFTVASDGKTLSFANVLVGDVWLASGQSNMEQGIGACRDAETEIANARYPMIRLFMVPNRVAPSPEDDLAEGAWAVCSPETVGQGGWGGFSGAAYYFGRELFSRLDVPVGLIDSTWGGTIIEPWTPVEAFATEPVLDGIARRAAASSPLTPAHRKGMEDYFAALDGWIAGERAKLDAKQPASAPPAFPGELLSPFDANH
jgi:sialate O-acetylesterase